MTPRERLYARMQGKPVDKIPNMNIAMGLVAKAASVTYREYAQDYRKLVDGNLICAERFGFDSVSVISDPMREASAFGARLVFPEEGVPYCDPPLLADGLDLKRIRIADPLESPRTLDRIKGVELLRQKVRSDYPVIGWVEGVLAETADLRGVNALMYDLIDDEATLLREIMDIVFSQQCRFATEQIKAGADIIGIGDAAASLVGPDIYNEFVWPVEKKLIDAIHTMGAKTRLHICGNTTAILAPMGKLGCHIVDLDYPVNIAQARTVMGPNQILLGNLDPVRIVRNGTPETIRAALAECHRQAGNHYIIGAGCEIPRDTPPANVLAFADYALPPA